MSLKHREDLDRVSAESHDLTSRAHSSCKETKRDIENSRRSIARSLELLGRRFHSVAE